MPRMPPEHGARQTTTALRTDLNAVSDAVGESEKNFLVSPIVWFRSRPVIGSMTTTNTIRSFRQKSQISSSEPSHGR